MGEARWPRRRRARPLGLGAVGLAGFLRRREGSRGASVDPAPVEQQQQEPQRHPERQVDVEQRDPRLHDVEALDRDQQAGDERPHRLAEQQLRHQRGEDRDADAGERRGEPPPERAHAERPDAEPDRELAERGVHPGADVPLVVEPVPLVARVDPALLGHAVGDLDAPGLGVVDLVEHELLRVVDRREPDHAGDRGDGEHGHHRSVQALRQARHRRQGTGGALTGGPVAQPHDELAPLEHVGDRRGLVVDEAGVEPMLLHGAEREVGRDLRGLLRPATQRRPAGSSARCNPPKRRSIERRSVTNSTATSTSFVALAMKRTSPGNGACAVRRSGKPSGASTSTTRDPGRMPSFFHRGVPE